jgi:uncharacterized coiled-coil protein SlyX
MRVAAITIVGLYASIGGAAQQASSVCERIQQLDVRIATQRANIGSLLKRYTEQHPEVMMQRKALASLEEARVADTDEAKSKGISCVVVTPPGTTEKAGEKSGAAKK